MADKQGNRERREDISSKIEFEQGVRSERDPNTTGVTPPPAEPHPISSSKETNETEESKSGASPLGRFFSEDDPSATSYEGRGNLEGSPGKARGRGFVSGSKNQSDPVSTSSTDNNQMRGKEGLDLARETHRNDACLKVRHIARAISTFLRGTKGETTFGLLGPWGRGKTYLTQFVESDLKRERYAVVRLNAWKHSKSPEIWAHLYQSIVSAAESANLIDRIPIAVRTGLARHGIWRLVLIGVLFGLGVIPLRALIIKSAFVTTWFLGLGMVFMLWRLFSSGQRTLGEIRSKYMTFSNHDERLGIQGTIGRDLSSLLNGWIPEKWGIRGLYLIVSFCLTTVLWFVIEWVFSLPHPYDDTFLLNLLGTTDPLALQISLTIWMCFVLVTCLVPFVRFKRVDQVLLIVDDLDRCQPVQVLDVIESLKVLLEDDVIKQRMQVLMLVEEDVLRNRIEEKYRRLFWPDGQEVDEYRLSDAVEQHIEKLFLCYYRMLPLSKAELREVTNGILKRHDSRTVREEYEKERTEIEKENVPLRLSLGQRAIRMIPKGLKRTIREQQEAARVNYPAEAFPDVPPVLSVAKASAAFSDAEKQIMADIVENPARYSACRASPRSIRSWLARYQLARLLIRSHEETPQQKALAELLWNGWSEEKVDPLHQTVVQQLMWESPGFDPSTNQVAKRSNL